jgi:hypothetical protein
MKIMSIQDRRQQAKNEAWYARAGLRRRLEEHPTVQVEDRSARWHQRAEETAEARDAEKNRRRHVVERQRREERQHEIALARATGKAAAEANAVIDADTLLAISNTLNALVRRLEAVEQKAEALRGEVSGASRQLNSLSAKTKSADERKGRQVAVLERKVDDHKDLVNDLRTEVRILKAQVRMKPQQQEPREIQVIKETVYR